VKVRIRSSK